MTTGVVSRAVIVWLIMACLAVGNGVLRDTIIAEKFAADIALPMSGVTLASLVFGISYLMFEFLAIKSLPACFGVGALWVAMTLAFECLFGHFVAGKSWHALIQSLNPATGDLFLLVLIVSFLSPYMAARIRGVF